MTAERTVVLDRAVGSELEYVRNLLRANDLPHADLGSSPARFFVVRADGERVGTCGLDVRGSNGLLRSLVVAESRRGVGFGTATCDELEDRARRLGVETVYLLTTTATSFFRRRGYVAIERSDAPPSIRGTNEFETFCPASATCLRLDL